MGSPTRSWFPKAAMLYVDMERGLYDWESVRDGRRYKRGSTIVMKSRILKDCGITTDYHDQVARIWNNPDFLKLVERERARRDHAIVDVIHDIEEISGPIKGIGDVLVGLISERLKSDPNELSTRELLQYGPQWVRLGLEVEGRLESQKQQGIEHVLATVSQGNKVTSTMLDQALDLVKEYRELQDRKLTNAGFIDGELDESE